MCVNSLANEDTQCSEAYMVEHEGVGPLLEHLEKQRNFLTFN